MQRTFIFNLALIIILNLIIKPFYIFGIDAEVQNQVGTSEYGLYFSLLNLTFLFNIILDFGIANYTSKTIAQHPNLVGNYFSKLLSIKFILFFLYLLSIIAIGLILNYNTISLKILLLLIFNQFLISGIQFIRANLTGLHQFKAEAFLSVFDRLLLIIICSILLWTNTFVEEFTIFTFIVAQMIAYGLTAIVSLLIVFRHIKFIKIRFNRSYTLTLLKQSAPYAILIFLMFIYNRIDAIMIERLLDDGQYQAGIYAQGFRYLDAVNMIALLFAGLLLPIYARLIKEKKTVYPMVKTPIKLLVPGSIMIAIIGYHYASTIMGWRYNDTNSTSFISFSFLILSFIPIAFTYIFGTLLTANGNLKILNYMALFGVILNLVLNFILIPKYKAIGAANATLITQSMTAIIQIIIAYRVFYFKIDFSLLSKILIFSLVLIGMNLSEFKLFFGLDLLSQNSQIILNLIIGTLLIFGFRFLRFSDLATLFKSAK
ncbi:MAG: oligosaccharide flippase family protein [Crocinitomicaceae bacterium]